MTIPVFFSSKMVADSQSESPSAAKPPKVLASWQEKFPVTVVEPPQRGERRVWVKKEAQLPVIYVGYHTPNFRSPDAYPLEVLSTLLSAGRTSRLYQRLVYEGRLALDAGGDYTLLTVDPDAFTFYATVLPEKRVEEVERVLVTEIERLRTDLVSDEELQRAKNQIEAVRMGSFHFDIDYEMAAISPEAILESAALLDSPESEAVFLPCTGLRASSVIEPLEQRIGKPVVTAHQAMLWHALKLAGHQIRLPRLGRLFSL